MALISTRGNCRCLVLCLVLALSPGLGQAQSTGATEGTQGVIAQTDNGTAASGDPIGSATPIVILNQERLLSRSLLGQRIQREVEMAGAALAAENRSIEARLTAEELNLTEQRATMAAEAFRPLAEDFDARVEGIRSAQEAKSRALQTQAEAAQARFFELAFPVLIGLLRDRGASVLMDSRAVLLSIEGADITDEAIALLDSEIGEGPEEPFIDLDGTAGEPRPRPGSGEASSP